MKKALTEELFGEVLSKGENFNLDVCYDMYEVKQLLEKLGYESKDDYETNGYQIDWWETFTKDGITLKLGGSFWYSSLEGLFSEE